MVPIANCVAAVQSCSALWHYAKGRLTISVASTRVPTIFRRTFVFFSMIYVIRRDVALKGRVGRRKKEEG